MSRFRLPAGPVLTTPRLAGLALVGGRYLQGTYLRPLPWADRGHFGRGRRAAFFFYKQIKRG